VDRGPPTAAGAAVGGSAQRFCGALPRRGLPGTAGARASSLACVLPSSARVSEARWPRRRGQDCCCASPWGTTAGAPKVRPGPGGTASPSARKRGNQPRHLEPLSWQPLAKVVSLGRSAWRPGQPLEAWRCGDTSGATTEPTTRTAGSLEGRLRQGVGDDWNRAGPAGAGVTCAWDCPPLSEQPRPGASLHPVRYGTVFLHGGPQAAGIDPRFFVAVAQAGIPLRPRR